MTLFDDGLYRGANPGPAFFQSCDFKTIINLQTSTREILFNANPDEELILCLKSGVKFYDFALSGIFPPSPRSVAMVLRLLQTETLWPVFLHCREGKERTGFIVAVYRMVVQGWSFDRAYAEWKAMGCRGPYLILWKSALKRWETK